ncbi:MAG: hypothetical protein C0483_25630 [Pirellula sp.]|nr:hypothetical protein [Pirellula sp.]
MSGIVVEIAPLARIDREIIQLVRAVGMSQDELGLLRAYGANRFKLEEHHILPRRRSLVAESRREIAARGLGDGSGLRSLTLPAHCRLIDAQRAQHRRQKIVIAHQQVAPFPRRHASWPAKD